MRAKGRGWSSNELNFVGVEFSRVTRKTVGDGGISSEHQEEIREVVWEGVKVSE